ncbi:MAG: radical SAM protein [Planctomycetota bacterium]|jgi:radical SAM protein with 4Fe4S-binding SPASM domain|nr:radical SAM protein [Planctomycetota bacterium]
MVPRIRLDNQGFLVQNREGRLTRIDLDGEEVKSIEQMPDQDKASCIRHHRMLADQIEPSHEPGARIDIAVDWSAACLTRPLRIYYNIEPACDLACPFCGPRKLGRQDCAGEKFEEFILREIAESGIFQVQLTGGEVFLRGEKLFATLATCRSLGLAVLLATNGLWSNIDDKPAFVKRLARFDNIVEFKVSIDGDRECHDRARGRAGSYAAAVETARIASECGLPTRINATILRDSCGERHIEHLAGLAKQIGASLQTVPERACGRSLGKQPAGLPSAENLLRYTARASRLRMEYAIPISFNFDILGGGGQLPVYDRNSPFSCGAGLWGLTVTHTGEVYPCGFAIEAGEGAPFLSGAVRQPGDLSRIWLNSPALRDWRQAEKSDKCRSCPHYRRTCWGGCKVHAFMMNGSLSACDPYCFA